jgi:hypothetical protein
MSFRVGDVLRYTRSPDGIAYNTPEVWVLVTRIGVGETRGDVISGSFGGAARHDVGIGCPNTMWSGREVVAPCDYPDHITAAVAARALLRRRSDADAS